MFEFYAVVIGLLIIMAIFYGLRDRTSGSGYYSAYGPNPTRARIKQVDNSREVYKAALVAFTGGDVAKCRTLLEEVSSVFVAPLAALGMLDYGEALDDHDLSLHQRNLLKKHGLTCLIDAEAKGSEPARIALHIIHEGLPEDTFLDFTIGHFSYESWGSRKEALRAAEISNALGYVRYSKEVMARANGY